MHNYRYSTWMWSRTDLAELREIPRSAEGPPHIRPTLRTLPASCCFSSSSTTRSSTTSIVERGTPTPKHRVFKQEEETFNFQIISNEFGESEKDIRGAKPDFHPRVSYRRMPPRRKWSLEEKARESIERRKGEEKHRWNCSQ